jgi:hypothetical protein
MSGFLNEALLGLERLLIISSFLIQNQPQKSRLLDKKSDSFTAFCFDCLEEDSEGLFQRKN